MILNVATGAEVLQLTNDGDELGTGLVRRPATRSHTSTSSGQVVDLEVAQLEGSAPAWTVKDTVRPHRPTPASTASRARTGTSPGPAAGRADHRTVRRAQRLQRPVAGSRPAWRRTSSGSRRAPRPRAPSCASASTPRPTRCPRLSCDARGRRALRPAHRRGVAAVRSRDQAQPRVLRGVRRRRGSRRSSGSGRSSRPTSRSSPTPSGATSGRPPRARRSPCSTSSARTPSRSTRTSARRRSRRCSTRADRFAYVLCRTSNPGAGELQALEVAADDVAGWPAEPLWARVARRAASWGAGGTVGLVVGATAPAEMAAIRALAPGSRVPRPGRRGAGRRDRAGPGERPRRRRRRPAPDGVAGCSSTSRGASPAPPWATPPRVRRRTPGSVSRRPP